MIRRLCCSFLAVNESEMSWWITYISGARRIRFTNACSPFFSLLSPQHTNHSLTMQFIPHNETSRTTNWLMDFCVDFLPTCCIAFVLAFSAECLSTQEISVRLEIPFFTEQHQWIVSSWFCSLNCRWWRQKLRQWGLIWCEFRWSPLHVAIDRESC